MAQRVEGCIHQKLKRHMKRLKGNEVKFLRLIAGVARTLMLTSIDSVAIAWGKLWTTGVYSDYVSFVRVDAIGDFIVWLKPAKLLRQHYNSRKSVLIANSAWADLARDMKIWDVVMPVDVRKFRRNMIYRISIVSRLSRANSAITVNPTHSRFSFIDDALTRATRAPTRIGSTGDPGNMKDSHKSRSDRIYNSLVSVSGSDRPELVRNFQFVAGLGIEFAGVEVADLIEYARSIHNPYVREGAYFVLMPGAGWAGRQWPTDRYAAIADHLAKIYGLPGVIVGGTGDTDLAARIKRSSSATLKDVTGGTDVRQLIGVIRDARLVVCNETSAVHVAASLGVPCVCVLGGGHFGRFAPYRTDWKSVGALPHSLHLQMDCFGCNWKCIYERPPGSAVPCVAGVTVDQAVAGIELAMQRRAIQSE